MWGWCLLGSSDLLLFTKGEMGPGRSLHRKVRGPGASYYMFWHPFAPKCLNNTLSFLVPAFTSPWINLHKRARERDALVFVVPLCAAYILPTRGAGLKGSQQMSIKMD